MWNFEDYGEQWAKIYDKSSHGDQPDTYQTVQTLIELATGGTILEFGIGTGRLALPLAERGVKVAGIEASHAMIEVLHAKPGGRELSVIEGSFTDSAFDATFDIILIALNTLCYLPTQEAQIASFQNAAGQLSVAGKFIVETTLPTVWDITRGQRVTVERSSPDGAELRLDKGDLARQHMYSTFLRFGSTGVEVRHESIRYVWPSELVLFGRLAGLRLTDQWGNWARDPFTANSTRCISLFQHAS